MNARAGTALKYIITPKTLSWHVSDNPYDLLACTSNRNAFLVYFLWHGSLYYFTPSLSFLLSETISLTDREYYLAKLDEKFLHGQNIMLSLKPGFAKHPVLQERGLLSKTASLFVNSHRYPYLQRYHLIPINVKMTAGWGPEKDWSSHY